MSRTAYLVRHTAVDVPKGTIYGHLDVPLLEDAYQTSLFKLLPEMPRGTSVFTSPLTRCSRLAGELAQGVAGALVVEERLRELSFGTWEGQAWKSIDRAESEHWTANVYDRAPPQGESLREVETRVLLAWRELLATNHGDFVLVAHAGPLRILQLHLEARPLTDWPKTTWEFGQCKRFVLA